MISLAEKEHIMIYLLSTRHPVSPARGVNVRAFATLQGAVAAAQAEELRRFQDPQGRRIVFDEDPVQLDFQSDPEFGLTAEGSGAVFSITAMTLGN
jgi:hypothetical protein